jgi:putative ABC transport system substrate-binding protein
MGRRAFVAALGLSLTARPPGAAAQPPPRVPRVGYLFSFPPTTGRHYWEACRHGLRDLGWVEGRTIALEPRWAEGHHDRLPALAADLVRSGVDVIVSAATPASQAARAATTSIPIVIVAVADPVKAGLVASFAQPGGNVTGLSLLTPELSGRRLQLLASVLRDTARVAILANPDNASHLVFREETQVAADRMGIQLQHLDARNADEIEQVFRGPAGGAGGLIVFDDPVIWSHRNRIVALAAQRRLAVMYGYREFVDGGGLMSYGPDRIDLYRRTASYVDRILRGARPQALPVEQPTKFELVINLRTARALGVTIPPALRLQADQILE